MIEFADPSVNDITVVTDRSGGRVKGLAKQELNRMDATSGRAEHGPR